MNMDMSTEYIALATSVLTLLAGAIGLYKIFQTHTLVNSGFSELLRLSIDEAYRKGKAEALTKKNGLPYGTSVKEKQ